MQLRVFYKKEVEENKVFKDANGNILIDGIGAMQLKMEFVKKL